MTQLFLDFLFKLAAFLVPWSVRRFYGPEKLAAHLRIRVRDEGDGIVFNCGELPNVRIWVRITNLSPVEIEFDRIFGHVYHGSRLTEFQDLQRRRIGTAAEIEFLIEASLTADHVTFLRKNLHQKFDTWLSLSGYIHSRLHTFQLPFREVRTKNVGFVNCAAP
jgi:hypothetical protein